MSFLFIHKIQQAAVVRNITAVIFNELLQKKAAAL